MARRRPPPVQQLELKELPTAPPPGRPLIVLSIDPGNFAIAQWVRDEKDVPVYRITRRNIKAAPIAATLARQEKQRG